MVEVRLGHLKICVEGSLRKAIARESMARIFITLEGLRGPENETTSCLARQVEVCRGAEKIKEMETRM